MTALDHIDSHTPHRPLKLPAIPPWVSPIVGLALFAGALWVIHNELDANSFHQLAHALRSIGPAALLLAAAAALGSYVCLVGGERLSLAMIGKDIPLARMWRASFTAYALGNALGFSFATAPAARARLYKDVLQPTEIGAVSALTGISVIIGALATAGVSLLFGANEIVDHGFGAPYLLQLLGVALLAPIGIWLALCARPQQSLSLSGVTARTPSLRSGALQAIVAVGDWIMAAGVLFILLPDHGGWTFAPFIVVFVASALLGAVSGAPGGIGVFEASILALAPETQHAPAALAALLAYRFIYTLAPLGIAAVLLGRDIVAPSPAARAARKLGSIAAELAPQAFSVLTFASGLILLMSSATPAVAARLHFLSRVAPLLVVELSHFFASITGVLLLVVAAALWRKLEAAYVATLALLGAGALFAVLKGVDFEEATILILVALVLAPCRSAFTRKSRLFREVLTPAWIAAVLGAVITAGWLGLFAYRDVAYSDELWWTFLRDAEASRFLRAAAGAALLVISVSLWSLLSSPRAHWRGRPSAADVAKAAVAMLGAQDMRGDAHLALLGDKDFLFSSSGKSFIMFRVRGSHWIAMSEPCGLANERRELLWRFVEAADEAGASPAFYSVGESMLKELAELGFAVRKIGETAIVSIQDFSLEGKARSGLRSTKNRVERDGASFEILPVGAASSLASELQSVSSSWLSKHVGAEKSFSLGRFDIKYLDRTPIAVVRSQGRIVAFANVWATPDKRELSIDLMRYGDGAPKNVMDYLFIRLIEWGKGEGYREFDLGMAPLAGLDNRRLAPTFSRVGAAVFEEGESLYGFRGLRAYKDKFDPEWRPLYLATRPGALMALAMLDAALLTSGGWRGLFTSG